MTVPANYGTEYSITITNSISITSTPTTTSTITNSISISITSTSSSSATSTIVYSPQSYDKCIETIDGMAHSYLSNNGDPKSYIRLCTQIQELIKSCLPVLDIL